MDWKIVSAIAVAAVIVIGAIFATDAFLSESGGGISGFFTALSGVGEGDISIDAVLDTQNMEFDTTASMIEVTVLNPSSEITLGSSKIDLSDEQSVNLEISGWNGQISMADYIALDGSASKIKMNGITVTPSNDEKLIFKDLVYTDLKIYEVSLPKISFESVSGYIYINDGKTTINVENEPVELESFVGDIKVDSSLRFDGITEGLLVSGENQMSIR